MNGTRDQGLSIPLFTRISAHFASWVAMAIIVFPSRNWLRLWPRSGQAGSRPSLPKCRPGSLDVLVQNRGANDLNVALNVALNVEREASDHFSFYAGVGGSFWNNGNALNLGGGLRWRFGDALKILSRKQAPLLNPPISPQRHPRPVDVAVSASIGQSLFAGGELGVAMARGGCRILAALPTSLHPGIGALASCVAPLEGPIGCEASTGSRIAVLGLPGLPLLGRHRQP